MKLVKLVALTFTASALLTGCSNAPTTINTVSKGLNHEMSLSDVEKDSSFSKWLGSECATAEVGSALDNFSFLTVPENSSVPLITDLISTRTKKLLETAKTFGPTMKVLQEASMWDQQTGTGEKLLTDWQHPLESLDERLYEVFQTTLTSLDGSDQLSPTVVKEIYPKWMTACSLDSSYEVAKPLLSSYQEALDGRKELAVKLLVKDGFKNFQDTIYVKLTIKNKKFGADVNFVAYPVTFCSDVDQQILRIGYSVPGVADSEGIVPNPWDTYADDVSKRIWIYDLILWAPTKFRNEAPTESSPEKYNYKELTLTELTCG